MTEDWLRDIAQRNKARLAQAQQDEEDRRRESQRLERIFKQHIDKLWGEFQSHLKPMIDAYNEEMGEQAVFLEAHPDSVKIISTTDRACLTLSLDRTEQSLTEHQQYASGGQVTGTPIVSFRFDDDGLAFGEGSSKDVARAVLGRFFGQ